MHLTGEEAWRRPHRGYTTTLDGVVVEGVVEASEEDGFVILDPGYFAGFCDDESTPGPGLMLFGRVTLTEIC